MNFPLSHQGPLITDARGEHILTAYDYPEETIAQDCVLLLNFAYRALSEHCAAFPPSLLVEVKPEEVEALRHLTERSETPPIAGTEPASTDVQCGAPIVIECSQSEQICGKEWPIVHPTRVIRCGLKQGHFGECCENIKIVPIQ